MTSAEEGDRFSSLLAHYLSPTSTKLWRSNAEKLLLAWKPLDGNFCLQNYAKDGAKLENVLELANLLWGHLSPPDRSWILGEIISSKEDFDYTSFHMMALAVLGQASLELHSIKHFLLSYCTSLCLCSSIFLSPVLKCIRQAINEGVYRFDDFNPKDFAQVQLVVGCLDLLPPDRIILNPFHLEVMLGMGYSETIFRVAYACPNKLKRTGYEISFSDITLRLINLFDEDRLSPEDEFFLTSILYSFFGFPMPFDSAPIFDHLKKECTSRDREMLACICFDLFTLRPSSHSISPSAIGELACKSTAWLRSKPSLAANISRFGLQSAYINELLKLRPGRKFWNSIKDDPADLFEVAKQQIPDSNLYIVHHCIQSGRTSELLSLIPMGELFGILIRSNTSWWTYPDLVDRILQHLLDLKDFVGIKEFLTKVDPPKEYHQKLLDLAFIDERDYEIIACQISILTKIQHAMEHSKVWTRLEHLEALLEDPCETLYQDLMDMLEHDHDHVVGYNSCCAECYCD